jgi:hypothetical protein
MLAGDMPDDALNYNPPFKARQSERESCRFVITISSGG